MNWTLLAETTYKVVRVESGINWPVSIALTILGTAILWGISYAMRSKPQQRKRR